jgi:ATP-dependent Clp protease ATP-binding subunit ClpC
MHFTIPLFERRSSGAYECTTLGLGPNTRFRSGSYAHKVHRKLIEDLRQIFEKAKARDLERTQMARGIRLARVRLELTLASAGERRKVSGVYPVVIEPRWASESERIHVAYHPSRQEESVPIRLDLPLEEQLRPYFSRVWAELDGDELGGLWSRGKERLDVLSFSCDTRSVLEDLPERPRDIRDVHGPDPAFKQKKRRGLRCLPKLGQNLTERAAQGDLATGMPRSPYREQLQLLLGAGRGQSVVVVGPPGSGKTTLLHQAIADLLEADGYTSHRNLDRVREAWSISGRRLIAGMSRLGDWEKRCVELLEDAHSRDIVLIVDDIHHFGRIGRSRESERSLADFFRGPLARREIILCSACTSEELRALEQDAPSFASLLTPIHLAAATPGETLRLMVREMRELEHRHHVAISPYTLRTVLDLSGSLLAGQAFPGKAMELLRELARAHEGTRETAASVQPRDVYRLLSQKTGMPEILLQGDERLDPDKIEEELTRQVLGQEEAVKVAVDLICRIKAGLVDARRPYGVYLFTGPTGTGKTELAKCIAEYLYGSATRLHRFDMSELSGPDAPARLIGHRYNPEGLLTEKVAQQPFSLVLFDEIEKAHPSVQSLLLQLFEDGRLTDAAGKTAHFNHTVVIMTSNLGARSRAAVGFGQEAEAVLKDIARAAREFFPPELFNRIDRIVPFRPLTTEVAERVAKKELDKLCRRRGLTERSIFVHAGAGVAPRIAKEAFEAKDGARSVKRFLEDRIGSLITEAIAGGAPAAMQILRLFVTDAGFGLAREALSEANPAEVTWALEPVMKKPLRQIKEALPALLGFVDALSQGDDLARLSSQIRYHLGQHNRGQGAAASGDREHAEAIYNLDAMRAAIRDFRERIEQLRKSEDEGEERHDSLEMQKFGWMERESEWRSSRIRLFHPSQMPSSARRFVKQEVLQCLAEGYSLRRARHLVDDPSQHAIFVELLRAGQLDEVGRFEAEREGLFEWLIAAYGWARGEIESWASVRRGEALVSGVGAPAVDATKDGGTSHVVLKIVGLCVLDFFELETGSHVWTSLARGPEVVRVRVWPAPPGETPAQILERHETQQRAFDEAIREGQSAPANPSALLPVVRKIRFDPPRRTGAVAPLEIEDYVMGYAETVQVVSVNEALAPLWLLRMSREDGGAQEAR